MTTLTAFTCIICLPCCSFNFLLHRIMVYYRYELFFFIFPQKFNLNLFKLLGTNHSPSPVYHNVQYVQSRSLLTFLLIRILRLRHGVADSHRYMYSPAHSYIPPHVDGLSALSSPTVLRVSFIYTYIYVNMTRMTWLTTPGQYLVMILSCVGTCPFE